MWKMGGLLSYYVTSHKYRNENLHSLRGKKMEYILNLLQWERETWETPDSPGPFDNGWNWTRMKTWLEASMQQTEKHKPLLKLPVEPSREKYTRGDDSRVNRSHSLTLPIFHNAESMCVQPKHHFCLLSCLALVPSTSSLPQLSAQGHTIFQFSISLYSLGLAVWPLICLREHLKWLLAAMEPHMIDASSSVPVSKAEQR